MPFVLFDGFLFEFEIEIKIYKTYIPYTQIHNCLPQDWYNVGPDAPWKTEDVSNAPSPFKPEGSPLFEVPGLASAKRVCIDSAHTWHIGTLRCRYANIITHIHIPTQQALEFKGHQTFSHHLLSISCPGLEKTSLQVLLYFWRSWNSFLVGRLRHACMRPTKDTWSGVPKTGRIPTSMAFPKRRSKWLRILVCAKHC